MLEQALHMTFTAEQQQRHRATFIDDCRQKHWGAACHANWVGEQFDKLRASKPI
jgi:hypothetical protein